MAAARVLTLGETGIDTVVAVGEDEILSPCGRCRQMRARPGERNLDRKAVIRTDEVLLRELLPAHWPADGWDAPERAEDRR